jgi:hypothetical protein
MTNGDDMTKYTFDADLFSDLHKSAYGFRPRGHRFYDPATTDDERQVMWDQTIADFNVEMDAQAERESQALFNLNALIHKNIALGAKDREQAIKWIVQSLNPDHQDLCYGGSWVCYELGLAFSQQHLFDQACIELRNEMEDKREPV